MIDYTVVLLYIYTGEQALHEYSRIKVVTIEYDQWKYRNV